MADKNLTLMLCAKDDLRLEERPIREPGYGEVQLEMKRVGICGSDIHFWTTGEMGVFVLDKPVALGHEGSGVVTKLGEGVTTLKVGDRVAVEPATPCRLCKFCKSGRYNLCREVKGLGAPGCDGHLCRYFVHAADFCHKIPDSMNFEEGAMMEPLACSMQGCNRAEVKMGDTILICGAGPIGLLCLINCRARGVDSVCVTDIDEQRLETAKKLGANHVIRVTNQTPQKLASEVIEKMGEQVDITLECSGATLSVNTGIHSTRPGGTVLLVGLGPATKQIDIAEAAMREVDIKGMFRYVNCFQPVIKMAGSGKIDIKPLITHRFDLENAADAFEVAKSGKGIKVMINCEKKK